MKRTLIVMFALVFIGSFAFAQDHESYIQQIGDGNTATVDQGVGNNDNFDAYANVKQEGNNNVSILDQNGPQSFSHAVIEQIGHYNSSDISTSNGGGYALVYMQGNSNVLELEQKGAFVAERENWFNLHIEGNSNIIDAGQERTWANIELYGSGNDVDLTQRAADVSNGHSTNIRAWGSNNTFDVVQFGEAGGTGGEGNIANVTLYSESNWNTIDVTQNGSHLISITDIHGSGNTVNVTQMGAD